MIHKSDLDKFVENNDKEFLTFYGNQLISNLSNLNKKEEKQTIFLTLLLLLFFLLKTSKLESFDIGPLTITDTGIIVVFIPIVFIYTLFNMYSLTFQKKEIQIILNHLYHKQLLLKENGLKENNSNKFSRAFFPLSISNTVKKIISDKPHIVESIIGFILLLPTVLIALLPYFVIYLMLSEIYTSQFYIWYGKLAFYISIWGVALVLFYVVMNGLKENE